MGYAPLGATAAAFMLVVTAYCLLRLVRAPALQTATTVRVDANHAIMGVAMAGMFWPALVIVRVPTLWWQLVFLGCAAACVVPWAHGCLERRSAAATKATSLFPWAQTSSHGGHLVANVAMIFMVARMPSGWRPGAQASSSGGMVGMLMSGNPGNPGNPAGGSAGRFGGGVITSLLALALLCYLVVAAVRVGERALVAVRDRDAVTPHALLTATAGSAGGAAAAGSAPGSRWLISPAGPLACEVVMSAAMAVMFIQLV